MKNNSQKTTEIGYIKPREITQEMKESYIDYAMSVIISRALPDVRDGLKPVHRRILYAMLEDGLRHDAKFRKSASVIGSTLSRYHPHGDMAVYDALVRMAQDFALRYPLIQGQGNFGSVDGDNAAAYRYCITGDSFVITNHCLEKIGEVSTKEDVNLKVLSFGGKINSASKWFDSGIHPTLKIKTFRGYSLKGSFNHPILTLSSAPENKPIFKWKLLNEVKEGDFAVVDRNSQTLWPKKEPSLKNFYPKTKNRRFVIHKLPTQMNPDLAFLMGAILAEGYISINKKRKYGKIDFCNTNKEFIDEFRSKFKKVFPDCPIYEQKRNPLSYGKRKFISFEICSLYLVELLKNLGLKIVPSQEKRVPQIIFHSTKESISAFLKGFAEGDGSIFICKYRKQYKRQKSVELTLISASEKLLKELQIILLRFGIDSFLRFEKPRKAWRLFIRGHNNLNSFKEQIGFVSKEKRQRLSKFSKLNSDCQIMSKTDFIPYLSSYLRRKYKAKKIKWVFKDWLKRHNLDRYPKLVKYHSVLKKFLEKGDLELINFFLGQNYLFDRIVSIKANGKEKVYSIRVDSKCHSFVSNGFISHNTECRLSKIGEEMLKDIEKNTVDFIDNYDSTRKEPAVLPSLLPQLLLNGSLGIAVGMATNIPPHNLSEVSDAAIYLIDHPKATSADLFKFIKGPDFPTGGIIYDQKEIITAYSQGKGSIIMRGKAEVLESKKSGRLRIMITEIPFQVQKSSLVEQLALLVQQKKIDGIKDIRDESDKEGMRIVIDLKPNAYPQKILNRLYKFSDLQKTFHLNMLALVEGIQPRVLNLAELLNYFILHRKEVVFRRTKYDLEKTKERAHILEGLHKCLANIDAVIKTIKNSESREIAQKNLIKQFRLTQIQANAILETKLATLARLERKKIEDELKEMRSLIKELSAILKNPQRIKEVIKKEFISLKENFGDERKTKVFLNGVDEIAEEDLIPEEETIITLTQGGYIKRINPAVYKIQRRGGKGILGMKTLQDDTVSHFLLANSHDSLLFFTDSGKVFRTFVYEIPEGARVARGRGLLNFLEITPQEKVLSIFPLGKADADKAIKYLVMVTQNGIIKKTALSEFENVRKSGLIAITLKKDDLLKKVCKSTGQDEVILTTKKGQTIRFKEKDIREMGRQAAGVKGIRLRKGDKVVGMDIIRSTKYEVRKNEDLKKKNLRKFRLPTSDFLLVVTENGYGKRTDLREYRLQKRGGSGIKTAKIVSKTGDLVASKVLSGVEEDLIVISQKGQVIRTKIAQIPKLGRSTQGVRIMKLEQGDRVASDAYI